MRGGLHMAVKLNQYWSIIPGRYEEYENFLISEFIPGVNRLGLQTVAAWSVLIGAYSEIILENASDDLEMIEKTLKDEHYKTLKRNLLKMVKNYHTKVLSSSGRTDSYTKEIEDDTIKFNQMWDVRSHKKDEYEKFINEEFFPVLEKLGVQVAGEWEILIGDGPGIICEGRVKDLNNLIFNLQSKKFQKAKRELKQLTENYRSRILTLHVKNSYPSNFIF